MAAAPLQSARLVQVQAVRRRLLEAQQVTARADGSTREIFPTSIGLSEGKALCEWVKRQRAALTFETDFGYGISTLFVCEGLLANGHAHARHVAIDTRRRKAKTSGSR
jgi:hypothetical protein